MMAYSTRTMQPADWDRLKFFKPTEPGFDQGRADKMGFEFMLWLDELRAKCKFPFKVTSTYRTPERNAGANGAKKSAHMDVPCDAVDIGGLDSRHRFKLVYEAMALGCRRIGVYENGSVHLDRTGSPRGQDVLWVTV